MKRKLSQTIMATALFGVAVAQTTVQGPNSSQSSYLQPLVPSSTITSIITATDAVNGYSLCGLPDGAGGYDNGDGTFTMLVNHEMGSTSGAVHAHGAAGAFVSKWIINKTNFQVISGTDLIQNVYLWSNNTYTMYNAASPSSLTAFGRFCAGDLPDQTAFYNPANGKGTLEKIYMNGEENGAEGRAFAHIATGPEAGYTYQLPLLGRASWENQVASPHPQDKTIVAGMDDATPGQVYIYIGTKTNSGSDVARAGLTNGKLYGVAVLGLLNESNGSVPPANTTFNLIDLGNVANTSGSSLNTMSNNMGVTNFLRPEDGAWDPSNPRDFYFVTTNSFNANSRMWRLRFHDISNPELGGHITAVLTGSEGQRMFDNMCIDQFGHIMLQEDPGNNVHNAKIWQYRISTNQFSLFAQHDTTRFISGGANYLTQDEESAGIFDAQAILGPGMFLTCDQAHYGIPSPIVEGGQLLALYNPASANANPEINVTGNGQNIPNGSTVITNGNFTDYGNINLGTSRSYSFAVRNSGPGILTVRSVSLSGSQAYDFSFISVPVFPFTVAVNGSFPLYFNLTPTQLGTRTATVIVNNNDFDERNYSFAIRGTGVAPEIDVLGNSISINSGNTNVNQNDNTDFGSTFYNVPLQKTFNIQNSGTGTLNISGISLSGTNTSIWTVVNAPTLPLSLQPGASQNITVEYLPVLPNVTNTALMQINSNDDDEPVYNFRIAGTSLMDVGLNDYSAADNIVLFPNPSSDKVNVVLMSDRNEMAELSVFNILGARILSTSQQLHNGENRISIDVKDLKDGEYTFEIQTQNRNHKVKMMVIH